MSDLMKDIIYNYQTVYIYPTSPNVMQIYQFNGDQTHTRQRPKHVRLPHLLWDFCSGFRGLFSRRCAQKIFPRFFFVDDVDVDVDVDVNNFCLSFFLYSFFDKERGRGGGKYRNLITAASRYSEVASGG